MIEYFAGIDLAFVNDFAALTIVRRHGRGPSAWLEVVYQDLRKPTPTNRIKPSELAREWCKKCVEWGVTHITADAHYLETMREAATEFGLVLHNAASGDSRNDAFIYLRHLTRCERVDAAAEVAPSPCLPIMSALVYNPMRQAPEAAAQTSPRLRRLALADMLPFAAELRDHMKSIRQTATTGGNLSINAPRKSGQGHADLAFSLVAVADLDRKMNGPIGIAASTPRAHRGGWASP